jgi:putative addiction module component (TIGR02574 family)
MSFEELRASVLALPEEQRMEIVDLLLETLPEEAPSGVLSMDDPDFYDELDRRAADTKTEHWKTWEQIRDEP